MKPLRTQALFLTVLLGNISVSPISDLLLDERIKRKSESHLETSLNKGEISTLLLEHKVYPLEDKRSKLHRVSLLSPNLQEVKLEKEKLVLQGFDVNKNTFKISSKYLKNSLGINNDEYYGNSSEFDLNAKPIYLISYRSVIDDVVKGVRGLWRFLIKQGGKWVPKMQGELNKIYDGIQVIRSSIKFQRVKKYWVPQAIRKSLANLRIQKLLDYIPTEKQELIFTQLEIDILGYIKSKFFDLGYDINEAKVQQISDQATEELEYILKIVNEVVDEERQSIKNYRDVQKIARKVAEKLDYEKIKILTVGSGSVAGGGIVTLVIIVNVDSSNSGTP